MSVDGQIEVVVGPEVGLDAAIIGTPNGVFEAPDFSIEIALCGVAAPSSPSLMDVADG